MCWHYLRYVTPTKRISFLCKCFFWNNLHTLNLLKRFIQLTIYIIVQMEYWLYTYNTFKAIPSALFFIEF